MTKLTIVQTEFLKILKSFMRDKAYALPEDFAGLEELFLMAQKHQMTAAVYEQIRGDRIWQTADYRVLFQSWKRSTIRDVMLQVQRAEGFLAVYEKLCATEIKPLVVKGFICRNMYSKPDYRISGDEDILVSRGDFAKCDEILRQAGFQRPEPEGEGLPYEIPYVNTANGVYIELHFSLFPESSDAYGHLNEEFALVHEHCICEEIQGKKIWTLGPTEHLFYLICHSFKHFLHSGFGLRQVCDMVMMAERWGERIDWNDLQERLGRLNMKTYWDALVQIGVEYFGFSYAKACYPVYLRNEQVDCGMLLEDLLDSGIYGDSSMERKHSSNMTLTAAAGGKANTAASLKNSLFPDEEYMQKSFPWLKKCPWLLPVAYGIRICRYLKVSDRKNGSEDGAKDQRSSVQIGVERVELLRQYDIIE